MDSVASLKSAWIFDKKGGLKETKKQQDKARAKQIYNIARQVLKYAPSALQGDEKLRRVSFMNGKIQWLVTLSVTGQIIVMMKEEED